MMNAVVTWFKSLEQREQRLVSIGAILLLAFFGYLALLAPLHSAVDSRSARVERKQQDLAWMRSVLPTLQSRATAQPANGESLVVLIDRTARQSGLAGALTGQTPNGEHGIRVRLENASFDSLIVWLGTLQQQFGVTVETANIDRTDKSGVVNANFVLTRAGQS